ncbi:XTP/dITP diphosphatase [Caldisalinibacter kiritimatiensis]|uniref:dITP/XTP pyrophosphatase n=1 Tax=Caldisalinibacter kiritimatiensis TaxID=1304284 RepID=R1CSX1_9FIRM|nr:XTP/dITP diphosphatase [Caldisalinibacter kiritimatiensis]EOD01751.1 Nucleoside 5-triphosphatase RdgB (dHAPTP, dITP, XTP-specific) [Caldisalinibacter kiritimatiensis]
MSKIDIVVSTGNKHKIEEIKDILMELPINVLSKNDVGLESLDVVEDGETLEENALKKASEISKRVNKIVIADDTGLFVDKLGGRPGVYSSRYAGEEATFEDNNKKLLKELENVPMEERTAKFMTVIAIVMPDGAYDTVIGECKGKIAFTPKGNGGFGYDPLFIVDGYDKTFAELGNDLKNKISHRAKALNKLREKIRTIIGNGRK